MRYNEYLCVNTLSVLSDTANWLFKSLKVLYKRLFVRLTVIIPIRVEYNFLKNAKNVLVKNLLYKNIVKLIVFGTCAKLLKVYEFNFKNV